MRLQCYVSVCVCRKDVHMFSDRVIGNTVPILWVPLVTQYTLADDTCFYYSFYGTVPPLEFILYIIIFRSYSIFLIIFDVVDSFDTYLFIFDVVNSFDTLSFSIKSIPHLAIGALLFWCCCCYSRRILWDVWLFLFDFWFFIFFFLSLLFFLLVVARCFSDIALLPPLEILHYLKIVFIDFVFFTFHWYHTYQFCCCCSP